MSKYDITRKENALIARKNILLGVIIRIYIGSRGSYRKKKLLRDIF